MSVWLEAARPRTLPAAVVPVLVGTAAAATDPSRLSAVRFVLALVVALALQVAVNFANDYFDGVRGVDTTDRVGPRRLVAAGAVEASAMKQAVVLALVVAGVAGSMLAALTTWWLVPIGAVCGLAALGYSGGPRPYASAGLGEVFVFVFFGLVATVGSQWVQDEAWSWLAVVAAVPVGLLATAILVVNNLRDIPTDAAAGKRTLAVALGDAGTRRLYAGLLALALVMPVGLAGAVGDGRLLLPLLATPIAVARIRAIRTGTGRHLIRTLEVTGRFHLIFGVLLAVGLLVRDRV